MNPCAFSFCLRPMRAAGAFAILAAVLLASPAVWANPLPVYTLQVNVQEPDPSYCEHPITSCSEINPYTEQGGTLEFDVLLFNAMATISGIETAIEWPSSWELVDYEICVPYTGSAEVDGHQLLLDMSWPDCYTATMFTLARIILNVTENGFLVAHDASVLGDCEPYTYSDLALASSAQAMAGCSRCSVPCTSDPCRAHFDVPMLAFEAPPNGLLEESVHMTISGNYGTEPCWDLAYVSTADWMQVAPLGSPYDWELDLIIDVDATQLAPGNYTGWIEVQSDCTECLEVVLTVPAPQGAPEPEERRPAWGGIKNLYRDK